MSRPAARIDVHAVHSAVSAEVSSGRPAGSVPQLPGSSDARPQSLRDWSGNRDHVVVGAAGAFLFDSKAYEGVVAVDGDSLPVERPDNPRAAYELRRLAPGLRAAAAALKAELQESGGGRVWVQVVVVVWSPFPQRVVAGDRVVFVHGNELVQWLSSRPAVHGRERVDALACSLDILRAGRAANAS